jgi:hypothetical protein
MGMPQGTKNRGFQPGEMVPGKGIFIGKFNLAYAYGKGLGIKTNWYDAAIELGKPKTFDDTAEAVANSNEKGRGGLHLNPARYAELFEKLKTGEAMGKHVIAPLTVLKAIYALRNKGEYKRMNDSDLRGKLITLPSDSDNAHWQWSYAPHRYNPDNVRAVDFTIGYDGWHFREHNRFSGRACFAEWAL